MPSCILVASIAALVLTSALTITPVPIEAVPVTLPVPSNDAEVQVTSPVMPMVRPVAKAVAVSALPVTSPVRSPTNPLVAVIVVDEVIDVAVTAGKLAAIFSNVTAKLSLDCTIGNNAPLAGVVVVDNSEIFLVAIYCTVQVVEVGDVSCQSPGAISVKSSC